MQLITVDSNQQTYGVPVPVLWIESSLNRTVRTKNATNLRSMDGIVQLVHDTCHSKSVITYRSNRYTLYLT
jgi:hypothetical protein